MSENSNSILAKYFKDIPESLEPMTKEKTYFYSKFIRDILKYTPQHIRDQFDKNFVHSLTQTLFKLGKGQINSIDAVLVCKTETSIKIHRLPILSGSENNQLSNVKIYDQTLIEIRAMKTGIFLEKDQISQIRSAVAIIYATVLEAIYQSSFDEEFTILEALKLVEKKINTTTIGMNHEQIQQILDQLRYSANSIECHMKLEIISQKIGAFIPDGVLRIIKEAQQHCINELALSNLENTINLAIEIGLFSDYQFSDANQKPKSICREHSLLNNKKLLKKLNGQSLNKNGNKKNSEISESYKAFMLTLFMDQEYKGKFKTITSASNELARLFSSQIEAHIKAEELKLQHNFSLKVENFPQKIQELIKKNKKLANHLIQSTEI